MVAGWLVFFVQYGICNQLIQRDFLENIGFYEMQKNLWRDRQVMMFDRDQHQQVLSGISGKYLVAAMRNFANACREAMLEYGNAITTNRERE